MLLSRSGPLPAFAGKMNTLFSSVRVGAASGNSGFARIRPKNAGKLFLLRIMAAG